MRVLVLALDAYDGEGGIQRFTRRLIGSLGDLAKIQGESLTALVALWDEHSEQPRSDVDLYFPCSHRRRQMLLALERLTRQAEYDVVIYTHVLLTAVAPLLCRRAPKARQILIAHGVEVWEKPSRLQAVIVRCCIDRVASVSRFTARIMQDSYGVDAGRFVLLPNAIDPPDDVVTTATCARPLRLLTVSRLVRAASDKHVDSVIRALPAILELHPELEHVIVGDGDALADLEEVARSTGVADQVRFVRWLPDDERDRLYDDSDVFVLPSTREGFGIVFLEAWAHGLPVVGGSDGAAPELLADGGAGVVVDPDPTAIALEVNRLLDDPQRRRRMGEEGRRRVNEIYSGPQFTDNLAAILGSLSAGAA